MLFGFLKYLQPTNYFQRLSKKGISVFPVADKLPKYITSQIKLDEAYKSEVAKAYDLSWRVIKLGYIGDAETYKNFEKLPVIDEYRFIRKNFNWAWVLFVYIIRILSLHNPIKETRTWLNSRKIKRNTHLDNIVLYDDYKEFQSQLITSQPLVSIVIPTLNRYDYLNDILKDLEVQDYSNFEVVVVDQSDDFDEAFYKKFDLNFNIIRQKEKALWLARNTAVKQSNGSLIALSEDDVRINSDWISQHLKCLDYFDAKVSAGVFYPSGQQIPKERSFFVVASQFATGNAMLYKSVFKDVGLFDRQFEKQRMGDGEFGMRLYLKRIKSISNPKASCVDVKAATGGLREMGSWDAFRPSKFFSPRPIPSVLYFFRRYFGVKATRMALLRTIPISIFPYHLKRNKTFLVLAPLVTIIILPLVIIQVLRSWSLASKKIKQGELIEYI